MRSVSRLKIFLFTVVFAAFGIFIMYAIDTVSEGWRVDHGATKNVTGADAVCKKVENTHASNDYFIPTASTTEWTAFQNNLPAGVTLNSCQFSIGNSLRFAGSANAHLSRTPGVSGNQKKWTWSAWVKRSKLSSGVQTLLSGGTDSNGNGGLVQIGFDASDRIYTYFHASSGPTATSVEAFRDPGAWYHVVVILDTAQAANVDRLKIFVNGQRVPVAQTIDANYSYELNGSGFPLTIGKESWGGLYPFDGYMADVYFIDGTAATPLTFAETDLATGSWRPKAYAGTYGTGGFHLGFSNGTSAATLAQDLSVNANHFIP